MSEELKQPEVQEVNIEMKTEEVKKKMQDLLNLNEVESLIKSNEHEFELDGIQYRIRKPTFKQKQEAYQKRTEKFVELLDNDKYILEVDLKAKYLKKGLDIDKMQIQIINLSKKRDDLMIKLGAAIKENASDLDLQVYKKEIELIIAEIQALSVRRAVLLEPSIENQCVVLVYSYLTYLLLEKKEGENWVKTWPTYNDFENAQERLINQASYYTTLLCGSEDFAL